MENNTRVAVIGIIVDKRENAGLLNTLLSEYGDYIIGRMGIPYAKKNVNIISVAVDAPQNVINSLVMYDERRKWKQKKNAAF